MLCPAASVPGCCFLFSQYSYFIVFWVNVCICISHTCLTLQHCFGTADILQSPLLLCSADSFVEISCVLAFNICYWLVLFFSVLMCKLLIIFFLLKATFTIFFSIFILIFSTQYIFLILFFLYKISAIINFISSHCLYKNICKRKVL